MILLKISSPNVGLEPTTPRLRVSCSTDWASRACKWMIFDFWNSKTNNCSSDSYRREYWKKKRNHLGSSSEFKMNNHSFCRSHKIQPIICYRNYHWNCKEIRKFWFLIKKDSNRRLWNRSFQSSDERIRTRAVQHKCLHHLAGINPTPVLFLKICN